VLGEPTASTPTPAVVLSPTATPPAVSAPAEGLRVQLQARDQECWIKVKADDQKAEMGTLQPGERREFVAQDRIVLNLGSLPSVSVLLNGQPAKLPSRNGIIAENVIITKDNYQKFIQQ
jgi:hypothetical protein